MTTAVIGTGGLGSVIARELVYDPVQRGKAQCEDDSTGAPQRVVVVGGGDRSSTDLCRQPSRRLIVGAREPQGFAACGELAGDDRAESAGADDRGGHDRNLPSVTPRWA